MILLDRIERGVYEVGQQLPTLHEINAEFFGRTPHPHRARRAYAPLVEAGIVKAQRGRNFGHILISQGGRSVSGTPLLAHEIEQLGRAVAAVGDLTLFAVEFKHHPSGTRFGGGWHPSRLRAERYAVEMLIRFGEEPGAAQRAVEARSTSTTDRNDAIYGVRIVGRTLDGAGWSM